MNTLGEQSGAEKYCIVGAGPCGLIMARAFLRRGIPFEIFERHSDVGGVWDMNNPGSPMYESAHLISSRKMSGFPGFPMPETYPDYPRRELVLDYIRTFAERYDLRRHIRFHSNVERAVASDEGVSVTVDGQVRRYRGIVCASGINWIPQLPDIPGSFDGTLRHSASYRSAMELAGKRVLIIGLGNSGSDIACDAAPRAACVHVSVRRGYYILPKHIFGTPADEFAKRGIRLPVWLEVPIFERLHRLLVGDASRWGMPKPDHKILNAHPLVSDQLLHFLRHGDITLVPDVTRFDGKRVHFKNGSSAEYDEVLLCTGYQRAIPYLAEEYVERERSGIGHVLTVFSRRFPGVFTLGFAEGNGALFPHADYLARLVAEYAHASTHAPEQAARFRRMIETANWDVRGERRLIDTQRHHGYCDTDTLIKFARRAFRRMGWPLPNAADYEHFPARTSDPEARPALAR
jgi:Flavin-binding monooxygenase-like